VSPTKRTLDECKRRGYIAQVVERFNMFAKVRVDLFGVIDLVAITPDGILGIQACAGSSHATRRTKMLAEPRMTEWCKHAKLAIWSWRKAANGRWTLREEAVVV